MVVGKRQMRVSLSIPFNHSVLNHIALSQRGQIPDQQIIIVSAFKCFRTTVREALLLMIIFHKRKWAWSAFGFFFLFKLSCRGWHGKV